MPIATYDLHLHTCWSYDGLAQAADYFRAADELGLRAIAITDHHVIDSLDEVLTAAGDYPRIRAIPAAELTVTTSVGAVDLVCLGFRQPLASALVKVFEMYHQWQCDCGDALVRGMLAVGFDWTEQDRRELLESYRPARILAVQGFTHVKNELQREAFKRRGFITTDEEYGPLLVRCRQASGSPPYPAAADVVPVLKAAGVLISIAHPTGYFERDNRQRMDLLCAECTLDGIECAHPSTPPELSPVYRQYCVEHGMISTAGSDCHVPEHVPVKFARHGGEEQWLDEVLERL